MNEFKEANKERRSLIKELAAKEAAGLQTKGTEIVKKVNSLRIVIRDFRESIDIDRMVKTASEMIRRDDATVTIFYGSDGKNARIMMMTGKAALEKGVNANEMIAEASKMMGGGGGGKPNFAQGGGTQVEKLPEAVKKIEETLRKKLKP
jgi:alanyl-tRNA synthetase